MSYAHVPEHAPRPPSADRPAAPALRVRAWVPILSALIGAMAGLGFIMWIQQAGGWTFGAAGFWLGLLAGAFFGALGSLLGILMAIRRATEATTWRRAG